MDPLPRGAVLQRVTLTVLGINQKSKKVNTDFFVEGAYCSANMTVIASLNKNVIGVSNNLGNQPRDCSCNQCTEPLSWTGK
jgi:hypothetical protein